MSLRAAKFGDHWRRAFVRDYPESIKSISLIDSKAISDTRIVLQQGIVALVGGNGVGKSTFAHAIAEGLLDASRMTDLTIQRERILGSTIELSVRKNGEERARRVLFKDDGNKIEGDETLNCNWLDPSLFSMKCRQQIQGDGAFEEILDGVTPLEYSSDQLAIASYIVGKSYTTCRVWEISEYGPFDVWPYFHVTTKGAEYRSEAMGQGELALLSVVWAISRCANNSVMILEEPETHVSSRSQMAFMDFLAKESATRGISFLLTTHSPVILQRIPLQNTFLLLNDGARSEIVSSPQFHHLSSLLGGGTSYKSLLVVEDETAKIFCDAILNVADSDISRQVAYAVSKDGESEIVRVLKTMPYVKDWVKLVGCFDGDQRAVHQKLDTPWPHIFLPGDHAPDGMLLAWIKELDATTLAIELNVSKADLLVALAAAEGVDHHDWMRHFATALNWQTGELIKATARMWARDHAALAQQFAGDLRKALG
ncbi:ATP-dependent nuclease [Burkholderia ubonensis]|uniref:ATP-dependent nuclease n=1 Tax=Burkholderia ubonensis TaxID=101571 RepID=UPI0009B44136|nr:AAA family ATPase [Burkholderia ubonensis]